jgi:hypothetical protein
MALTVTIKPRGAKPSGKWPLTVSLGLITPTVADLKTTISSSSGVSSRSLSSLH